MQGREQAFTGRQECTVLALRPEPKDSRGATGRPAGRNEQHPSQMGMVDTKEAMTMYMQQNAGRHTADGDRADKRMKLDVAKFEYDRQKEEEDRREREARRKREVDLQEKQQVLERDRLEKDDKFRFDKLAADTKRDSDRHALATLQEANRAEEAKRQHQAQMDAQQKQSDAQSAQTKMMFDLVQHLLKKD